MKKKLLFFIIALIILVSASILIFLQINKPLHKTISLEDISDIEVYGKGIKSSKVDDPMLIKNITEWFGKATDIRPNKDFAGTTSESGIIINLISGKRILILRSGSDFEIQRDDVKTRNISYWAKQDDLKKMLEQLTEIKVMPSLNIDNLIDKNTGDKSFMGISLVDGETVYYEREKTPPFIKLKFNGKEVIITDQDDFPSKPSIAPDKKRLAYIAPCDFETKGEVFIYDVSTNTGKKVVSINELPLQHSAKQVIWYNDKYLLFVVGYTYGTYDARSHIYAYDTVENKIQLIYKEEDGKRQIRDMKIENSNIILQIDIYDDKFISFKTENKTISATELTQALDINRKRDVKFSDFAKPTNISSKLIREATYTSKKGQENYYEYECYMPLKDIKQWLVSEARDNYGIIIKELSKENSIQADNAFTMKIEIPGNEGKRFLYIYTPKYRDKQHLVIIETTYIQGQEISEAHEGEVMLLFIPMNDGTVKEVLLSDYFHEHSDGYYLASYVLKAYNDELRMAVGSIRSEITGEEALLFEVTPLEPFNGWRIKLPGNKLPIDSEKKKLYLDNMAHSLLTGFKNTSGIIPWQEIILEIDSSETLKYNLKDFEGSY